MNLRRMLPRDLEQVAAVETAAAAFPWPQSQFASSLVDGHICTVLQIDDVVLGFTVFSKVLDESTLLNIAVHPDFQGHGYGRQLLQQGLTQLVDGGIKQCFLEVRVSNNGAKALYQSLGFDVVGERKQYYPAHNGREDALVMSCQLFAQPQVNESQQ
ncbi:ribosomal protein S18-alanine N-acetyltransferase [Oceanicoccus sp. KOV_DT_Chl]|uniref:ribosomal protein S18-alanine N-acetyltransferase n=1 Tax=Oceanicoccus sp. KOV_DT_Chl TaxID=1904639 RepID=UPI000C7E4C9C|nr:ribosomal protein S18-alanine N-acetyltransferase [Oceanicoccus sp. KOV_DT_Chl]